MAVYGYRIISRPASAFDWCEDEGGSRAQGGVDQRGKQDRHLIRSGLVVIAGGLADNIEQPLSLGAVLAWTSHHDLRLPGYSLLKQHIPELPAMHYALVHPPSHCHASAGRMHAATKASAEPSMRMPQT
jgi:hypothetical protein